MAGTFQEDGSSLNSSPLFPWMSLSPGPGSPYAWLKELKTEERGLYLIQLLQACAYHVAAGSIENADIGLEHSSHLASADGNAMQRIAAYFAEALADRMLKASRPGLHKALNSTKISSLSEKVFVQKLFFELCPFLKVAYVITNQAIIEAMEGEKMVHIIDLYSFEPAQWIDFLQTISARPEGPPHLRITGIHEHKEVLEQMALRLTVEAERLDIPFRFIPILSKLEDLDLESLGVKTGEALAVSSVLQLHSLLAADEEVLRRNSPSLSKSLPKVFHLDQRTLREFLEKDPINVYMASPDSASTSSPYSPSASPRMRTFLNSLWALSPKLMVVTEQEANHNGFTLMERAIGALHFYAALFDSLESTVSRLPIERQKIEKTLFGEEIKNIIACEGAERKERHEKLEKWIARLESARFGRVPFSYHSRLQVSRLLKSYGDNGYNIKDENDCLVICWNERPLFSVSAWRFRR
ncbi:GRAS family protein TF80-like [Juglans microcarpa x Juglans regia]|uniref:GRAS family protein TF80-like n=1 Tax=Juglans microcarpa x Juglans regia TaxID=2249226 RepID=UPI001B7D95F1|nr:GRAS family protein TF80-like [Juglans microcarpa x Juglans regia]XP_040993305.1 GRAS family protein TF80-like [Juglans microcarpa x Juglans regia]